MRKVWVDSYEPGVPAEIDLGSIASLCDLLEQTCREFPGRPAFTNLGHTITFAELNTLSRDFAAWLQSLPGLREGSRIALMMPNILQYPVALFGVLRAGMVVVNVNPLYTPRELREQLVDSGAEAIVVLENYAHVVEQVLPATEVRQVVTTQAGDLFSRFRKAVVNFTVRKLKKMVPRWRIPDSVEFCAALARGAALPLREVPLGHGDIAFLQYTGGTTGVSKGAILTHGNIVANIIQAEVWAHSTLERGKEVAINALPLYHIFSLTNTCLLFVRIGGCNVLVTNPRDIPGLVRLMRRTPYTVMVGVNTLFNALTNDPDFPNLKFKRLKLAIGGGAAIHRSVADRWLHITGRPLVEGYGLTESSPLVTCNLLSAPRAGSIGLPVPSTEVAIMGEDGHEVPCGHLGEICVRGPQVMRGYWNHDAETAAVLRPDGWLRTGDIGAMDAEGYVTVTDRKKDMILVSGFNVYPNEVEEVIARHPGVQECAVIGVPNSITGETVKAYVVPKEDADITAGSVIAHCRHYLTSYKVPKKVELRAELPKTPIGKVLRRQLKDSDPDYLHYRPPAPIHTQAPAVEHAVE